MIDQHGQPINHAYNAKQNRQKSLEGLLGICEGLVADQRLNEQEILFFDTWLKEQEHLRSDPDAIDILDATGDILSDGIVAPDEIDDLIQLIRNVLDFRDQAQGIPLPEKQAINRLIGICRGMAADGYLDDREIRHLERWLVSHATLADHWPVGTLLSRVRAILADNIVTEEERQELTSVLLAVIGGDPFDSGVASGLATQLPLESVERIHFEGTHFCFTGRFLVGTRKHCEQMVAERGGLPVDGISKKLDYLVVGIVASRDWAASSFGRKIQQAVTYRDEGVPIKIISEQQWATALNAP